MRYRAPAVAGILLALLVSTKLAFAKGLPDKIVISGGDLRRPVELTDSLTRWHFNPWTGAFAAWRQPIAPGKARCTSKSYDVRCVCAGWPGRRATMEYAVLGRAAADRVAVASAPHDQPNVT